MKVSFKDRQRLKEKGWKKAFQTNGKKKLTVMIPLVGNSMQTKVIWKRKEWYFTLTKVSINK